MINGQMLLENPSWIDKIVKISEMLKNYMLVGLGKNFGRSVINFGGPVKNFGGPVKNFGGPGQFGKVWEKRSRGSILAKGGGEISWNSILPPKEYVLPLKCPPPQILTLLCAIKAIAITWLREFFLTITAQRGGTFFGATWYKLCKMN